MIREALENEFYKVRDFYWRLIDDMQTASFRPGWQKGVYPSDAFLHDSLRAKELYVMIENEHITSAMILNHTCNEGYKKAQWGIDAEEDEITMIHALGVLPEYQGMGHAKEMVKEAIRISKEKKQKAIRLDVLNGNHSAIRLYEGFGFQYRCTVSMFYEDTGWTDYLLYELPLSLTN